jgi:membrane-associated phospholipid phosphatase
MMRERKYYLKVSLICYLIWIVLFEAVGHYAATMPTRDLTTFIDRQIPLIPEFVWPYELCYVFPFLLLVLVQDWHRFNRALLGMSLASLSAFLVYLTLPIAFPRPELGQTLSERMLAFEYRVDFQPGANKLPSLHVATAWLVYLACRRQRLNRYGDALLFSLAVLISVSTLFVKQHVVVDVVAGVVWGVAAWHVATWFYPRMIDTASTAPVALKQAARRSASVFLIVGVAVLLVASALGGQGLW